MKDELPPGFFLKLLKWFCNPDYFIDIEGDLLELYKRRIKHLGKRKANWCLLKDVLLLFRPGIIRSFKPIQKLHTTDMLQHTILITFRNFKKHTSIFLINLTGLSTGLACALLIYLWVHDELSIDKFHDKDLNLYQVLKTSPNADGSVTTRFSTPVGMAQALVEDLPEVAMAVPVVSWDDMKGVISNGNIFIKAKQQYVGEDYFNVFSFSLIHGDKDQVLSEKLGVLLSDELALKLYNTTEDLIGKTVEWEWWKKFSGSYIITGIFKAPPPNSSERFDLIFSQKAWVDMNSDDCWCNNNAHTYVVLEEGTDVARFNDKIRDYSRLKYKQLVDADTKWEGTLQAQKYSDTYLFGHFENGVQAGGKIEYVRLFSVVGFFILLIACINFINLSTAKSSGRIKEVGIKKVVGVKRRTLILQFMGEALVITIFSLAIAILLVYLLLPSIQEITHKNLELYFDKQLLITVGGLILVTAIISGSYPAFYLSRFRPAQALKGTLKSSMSEKWVRQGLVVFQFAISILLIVAVAVVYKQIEFIQSKNLGYNKDNIIRIENEGNLRPDAGTFLNEVRKIPGVIKASRMSGNLVGTHSGGGGISWEGKTEGISFDGLYVDHELIETLDVEMAEGRTFLREYGDSYGQVIFNKTAISMMGLKDPIGQKVMFWGKEKKIVGIVEDFHYESFYKNVGPFFFSLETSGNYNNYTVIKLGNGREKAALAQIEKLHNQFNPGLAFDFPFLDQEYQQMYKSEEVVAKLSKYFSGFAILISCLGLFGLAKFVTENRIKEIGIRKVLGSSVFGIIRMLTGDFSKTVILAIAIALPFSYLIVKKWLDGFAYRIDLNGWYFFGAGLLVLLIAWFTVGLQTIKAAQANPVNCLKNE